MRKLLMVAGFAMAAMAFAMPAAAQATAPVIEGHEHFRGTIRFTTPGEHPAATLIGCDLTVTVSGNGTTTAEVEVFKWDTETCVGTGFWASCIFVDHASNVPFTLHSGEDHNLVVEKDKGNIRLTHIYEGCIVPGTHFEFETIKVTPVPTEGPISALHIYTTSLGGGITTHGTLFAETDEQLVIST